MFVAARPKGHNRPLTFISNSILNTPKAYQHVTSLEEDFENAVRERRAIFQVKQDYLDHSNDMFTKELNEYFHTVHIGKEVQVEILLIWRHYCASGNCPAIHEGLAELNLSNVAQNAIKLMMLQQLSALG